MSNVLRNMRHFGFGSVIFFCIRDLAVSFCVCFHSSPSDSTLAIISAHSTALVVELYQSYR